MAKEIDLDKKIEAPVKVDTSGHGTHYQTPYIFQPMRRKLFIPEKE